MTQLLIILKKRKSRNYVWIYKNTNNFLIRIGHQNNTLFDSVCVDYELLQNIIHSLVKILKTHKYYFVNIELLSDVHILHKNVEITKIVTDINRNDNVGFPLFSGEHLCSKENKLTK